MLITEKTAVTFILPEEKELMEKFMADNPDWYYEVTSNQVTFKRTQMLVVGRTQVQKTVSISERMVENE